MALAGSGLALRPAGARAVLARQQVPAQRPLGRHTGTSRESAPTMPLEGASRDPLRDTVVQRWRDPRDGRACFADNPIPAPPLPGGRQVQCGPSTIRSVRCMHPARIVRIVQPPTPEPPRAAPSTGGPR